MLERWPRWWGVGNLFATAVVGNDAQRKKGQDRSPPMPHFLLTFGDASRPPVGAVILEAPSMHYARMTAVVRRLASGVPFGESSEQVQHRWSYAGDWVTRSIRQRGEPAFR